MEIGSDIQRIGNAGIDMRRLEVKMDFEKFPARFTCDGENISPRILIGETFAKTIAIILEDPDAPSGTFTHWIAWNIEPMLVLAENIPKEAKVESPTRAIQGRNTANRIGYMGPCPPRGKPHRYLLKVHALDLQLDLPPGASRNELERAMEGHVIEYGETMATYQRQ
jgi:Raf kinase inhibitor-like YbhB/YbcL family protein